MDLATDTQPVRYYSELDYRAMLDAVADPIAVAQDDEFLYANAAWLSFFGFKDARQLAGEVVSEQVRADHRAAFARALESVRVRSGVVVRARYRFHRHDQRGMVEVDASLSRVELSDGVGALISIHPVNDAPIANPQLAETERMASLGTLAAGVAHEINNPLAYVLASLELGARELEDAQAAIADVERLRAALSEALGALQNAREGAERVRNIVRDLMDFSRAGSPSDGAVSLEVVLDSAIRVAWNEIRHRARLVKRYGGVAPVAGDDARIGQVFLNLLMNAAQAIDGDPAQNEITLITSVEAGRAVVEVSDTGSGISPDEVDRIFDPFYTTKPSGKGTGLGLAICHGIVTALGGAISVKSELGKGSTFRVTLPLAPETSPSQRARATAPPDSQAPPSRILIIDDEPLLGQTLSYAFKGRHDVVSCTSGRDALARLEKDARFDLVLCDLMMPDIGGAAVYQAVLRDRPSLAARFVFITGGAFTEKAREFLEQHPGARLEKPFTINEVERLLGQLRTGALGA
ncbi:MAG TPA: ATP-binding protein [Polyangiaceae bacterium]|jgi:PAS domain S-box-containing protein